MTKSAVASVSEILALSSFRDLYSEFDLADFSSAQAVLDKIVENPSYSDDHLGENQSGLWEAKSLKCFWLVAAHHHIYVCYGDPDFVHSLNPLLLDGEGFPRLTAFSLGVAVRPNGSNDEESLRLVAQNFNRSMEENEVPGFFPKRIFGFGTVSEDGKVSVHSV